MAFDGTQEAVTQAGTNAMEFADGFGVWGVAGAYFLGGLAAILGIGKGAQFVAGQAGKLFKGGEKKAA